MSLQAYKWTWKHRGLTPRARLVLLALADCCNGTPGVVPNECWPSLTRLQTKTELSRSTVCRGLDELASRDPPLITRQEGGGDTKTRYFLHLDLTGDAEEDQNGPHQSQGDTRGGPRTTLPQSQDDTGGSPSVIPGSPRVTRGQSQDDTGVVPGCDRGSPRVTHRINKRIDKGISKGIETAAAPPGTEKPSSTSGKMKAEAIPCDWQPSSRVMGWAGKQGMSARWVNDQVDEFVIYWADRKEARASWDATFMHRLRALHKFDSVNDHGDRNAIDRDNATRDFTAGATPISEIPWMHGRTVG